MKAQWNQRYSSEEYKYGKEPNQFLKAELSKTKPGRILFIGEGEGRNAVYAASVGWKVDAIDFSDEAKRKAMKLADKAGVKINYDVIEFSNFQPESNLYDAIGIIFIHLDESLRKDLFNKLIESLKNNGKIIFECFEKDQLKYESGGPKDAELLYSLEDVVDLIIDLEFEKLSKEKVFLSEGNGHYGEGIVIRFVGIRR